MAQKKKQDSTLDAALLQAKLDDLQKQYDALNAENTDLLEQLSELSKLKDLAARAQADLQNAKARLAKQGEESRTFALEGFIRSLLPTLDNLDRAFGHLPIDLQGHEWVAGIEAVDKEFHRILGEAGLSKINAVGSVVDPTLHDVLLTAPGEEEKVVAVLEEGYMLKDRVLRPAKVSVGNGEV